MVKHIDSNGLSDLHVPKSPALSTKLLSSGTASPNSASEGDDLVYHRNGDGAGEVVETKNALSTLYGVYIPCMLSILGAILFLRLSWAVGQVGFFGVVGIFAIAGSAVFLTALSISAISTNGTMGGGGAYYMISRSLGPEFGGAVGVIFYFANAFATTFYLVAFAENFVDTFLKSTEGDWYLIMVASSALFMILIAAYIGADFFSKLNALIMAFIVLSISVGIVSLAFGDAFNCTDSPENPNGVENFTGISATTLDNNLYPNLSNVIDENDRVTDEMNTFFRVFGIVFPAMTGIMAGANLSGDLENPGRSIGRGTLYAIASSIVIYIGVAFLVAWTIDTELLQQDKQALQRITCWTAGQYFIVLGVVSSTLSSGLGALTGAARVLQAFCKDFGAIGNGNSNFGRKFTRVLQFFAVGTPIKNEPRRAVLVTWAIAQSLLFLGSLDLLAAIITNCFLLTYFFTNFACFILKITGAPNFRPRFKYFSWHTALLGALLNIVIMFLASPIFAGVSIVLMLLIFAVILYSGPQVPWGDISQALIYHQVRKYLLQLDERKSHPKFWRPSILLIVTDPAATSVGLIDFCNNLKKGGLYVVGDVVLGTIATAGDTFLKLSEAWNEVIPLLNAKAFSELVLADSVRAGCQTLMLSAGLGGMKPNTVVIPFLSLSAKASTASSAAQGVSSEAKAVLKTIDALHATTTRSSFGAKEFVGTIRDVLAISKNLLVARDFELLNKGLIVSQVTYGDTETVAGSASKSVSGSEPTLLAPSRLDFTTSVQGSSGEGLEMQPMTTSETTEGVSTEGVSGLPLPLVVPPRLSTLAPIQKVKKKDRQVQTIDIWFTDELEVHDLKNYSGNLSLLIQLAYGLNRTDIWQEFTRLRLVLLLQQSQVMAADGTISQDTVELNQRMVKSLLESSRVVAEVQVLVMDDTSALNGSSSYQACANAFIKSHMSTTAVVFMNLPLPPAEEETVTDDGAEVAYVHELCTLTEGLPPTVLAFAGHATTVIATEI